MRGRSEWGASARGAGSRLSFTVGAGLAVAGGAGAFALCHSIDPGRGPLDAGGKIAATILALSTGLVGLFELHRLRIEDAARGRVAPGPAGGLVAWRLALGIASGLFAIALVLATGAEVRSSRLAPVPMARRSRAAAAPPRRRARAPPPSPRPRQSRPGPRGSSPPTLPGGAAAAPPTRPPARARSWAICSPTCPCSRSSTRAAPGPIPTARCICAVS